MQTVLLGSAPEHEVCLLKSRHMNWHAPFTSPC